ncbi:UDP-N-acetylmuramoyl-L-alanine--D-glutamate ligase [Synechococcus sp. RSCCF101]|uniref:UDP-N-acetylmuramoyl-L-alanine--D-glutamate ligase n=1 Tax=Synechococcus sp. RSCCF101 TaxID=2511069 RepID=UPI001245DB82|nr:UDP-N-acetylmuramoyl-L-alanine--D-glutamate ligase [Synechococcus sp. RSCCF101]QEY33154.1 UDP-N-acetylmuramoyl-L-alanine--D-glutamate ligase [Synechococcus sp. RSCCF101]
MDATAVIGLGRSGLGAARLLSRAPGTIVVGIDSAEGVLQQERAAALRAEGIAVALGCPLTPDAVRAAAPPGTAITRVILSPGIAWDHPAIEAMRRSGIQVDGEMVVAWQTLRHTPWVGITGTNGKTTVTHLLNHVLTQAGLDAPMCGNVGFSATELALERHGGAAPEAVVAELSSYQIEAAACIAPRVGVWTTLTPDHLERHGTIEAYRAIKRGLLERSQHRILNADDPDIARFAASWDQALWVTAGDRSALPGGIAPFLWVEGDWIRSEEDRILPVSALAMPGRHNRQNMLLCCGAALALGVEGSRLEPGFRSFKGVPHRLETLRQLDGLTIINDSKATNFDAAEVGLAAIDAPAVVLAGGQAKTGDPEPWIRQLSHRAAAVVLYGASRQALAEQLTAAGYPGRVTLCTGLNDAVPIGLDLARQLGCRTLLLSPACASFDQFRDFEDRGDQFRHLVEAL